MKRRSLLEWQAPSPHADVAEVLGECHARIRYFASLCTRVTTEGSCVDARDAAARIRRYFSESLPLHEADEEESVYPRLRKRFPEAGPLLDRMELEHRRIDDKLVEVLAACRAVEAGNESGACTKLAALGEQVQTLLEAHISHEESVLFPLVREHLSELVAEIRSEFRARRGEH